MPDLDQTFACPHCGQQFPWKPQYAGRKLACACGGLIEVQTPAETETYDLREDQALPAAAPTRARPARVEPIDEPPPGQLALNVEGEEIPAARPAKPKKVLGYRRLAAAEQVGVEDDFRSRRRDYLVPMGLIAICLPMLGLLAFAMAHLTAASPVAIAWHLGMRIAWDLAMTLLAGLVFYWSLDTGLGEAPSALLKLIAIGLFRFSLSAIVQPDGNILLAMGGFLLTFPFLLFLFSYLFQFDFTESMFCTVILSAMRLISYFGLWRIL